MAVEDSTLYANPAADAGVPSSKGVVAVPIDATLTPPKDATASTSPPVAWPAQQPPPAGASRTKKVLQVKPVFTAEYI